MAAVCSAAAFGGTGALRLLAAASVRRRAAAAVTAASASRPASTSSEPAPAPAASNPTLASTCWSWGDGYLGCLGHRSFDDVVKAQQLDFSPAVEASGAAQDDGAAAVPEVADVSAGWGHSAVVTTGGQLLVCGRTHDFANTLRQINLNRGPSWIAHAINYVSDVIVGVELVPHAVEVPDGVAFTSVACSPGAMTAALTDNGAVYCYGSNDHGQCGIGYLSPSVYTPEPVPGVSATKVVAGFQHVLALGTDGGLYVWGRGDRGQLGLGDRDAYKSPLQVLGASREVANTPFVDVAAGFSHSAALSADGNVWVFGKMQATTASDDGRRVHDQLQPARVELPTAAAPVFVTCGQAHTCVLTDDNHVWMRGLRGRGVWYDETGTPPDDYCLRVMDPSNRLTPHELMQYEPLGVDLGPFLHGARVVQLTSGVHHSFAVLSDGRVLQWGWRLGVVPVAAVEHVHVTALAQGFGHTLVTGWPR